MNHSLPTLSSILGFIAITSCSTFDRESLEEDYASAMMEVRNSVEKRGIPRDQIFYHFQLYGATSVRMYGGARGGFTHTSETWDLPNGYRLTALEYTYVGRDSKIIPLKEGESFFSDAFPGKMKNEYYHEPSLEPFFDTLFLFDDQDESIESIDLHRKIE